MIHQSDLKARPAGRAVRRHWVLEQSRTHLVHRVLDRFSPLAVPVLLEDGKQRMFGAADEALLAEIDALARAAKRLD